jgi:uncharacterized protein (DUF488 family)
MGKNIDEFINLLKTNNVHILIDVRKNAFSFKPDFNKTKLKLALEQNNIEYWHKPELGVPSDKRKNLDTEKQETYRELWDWYDENVIPNNLENVIMQLSSTTTIAHNNNNHPAVVFMCREVEPFLCHRHRIAKALEETRGMKGIDL